MPSWSTATTRQPAGGCGEEPPPQVGPGGVAVHAQQGARALGAGAVVEDVPGARYAVRVDDVDQPGPAPGRARASAGASAGRRARRARPRSPDDLERTRRSGPSRCPSAAPGRPACSESASLGQGERHGGRARCCRASGSVSGSRSGSMSSASHMARGVHLRDLVGDVAVDAAPSRTRPGRPPTRRPTARARRRAGPLVSVRMQSRSPTHRSWCSVPARATPPTKRWPSRVRVGAAEDHRRRARARGSAWRTATSTSSAVASGAGEPVEGDLLGVAGVLAVDDQRVVDLAARRSSWRRAACR